jgi:hypothetical protein
MATGRLAGEPRPGEEAIQETITTQWETVQEDELSFSYTMDARVALNRRVWLQWIADLPEGESARARSLDVGCGVGTETMAPREATGVGEAWGVTSSPCSVAAPSTAAAPRCTS